MAFPVIMPKQGQSVESCIITRWNKAVGDKINVGDELFSYETDKASFVEEAKEAGTLLAIFFPEGEDVACFTNVCVIGNPGEDFSQFDPKVVSSAPAAEAPAAETPKTESAKEMKKESKPAPVGLFPVIMPKQGQSVESCIITKWNKSVGDSVAVGDVLFSYETDKASFDEEAKEAGTLLAIFFPEGEDVPCFTNVCVIGPAGSDAGYFDPNNEASSEEAAVSETVNISNAAQTQTVEKTVQQAGERLKISPRAKAAASKAGVNPAYAGGSGPGGRIIERDIVDLVNNKEYATLAAAGEMKAGMQGTGIGGRISTADLATIDVTPAKSAAASAPAVTTAEYTEEPLTNIRKAISKAMTKSLTEMAQLTLNSSFDATEVMAFRKKIKASAEKLGIGNITVTDLILYAVSRTLMNHKFVNANMIDDKMRFFTNAHIGLAVDTPKGLLVPTIFNANKLSLNDISKEAKKLASDAQNGTIGPDYLRGGSFTVTNLGTFGIETFTPVINPPQTCILGVNTIVNRVKEVNGEIKMYPAMGLSLTFDHRALDGAPAARFLKELVDNLENISALMIL